MQIDWRLLDVFVRYGKEWCSTYAKYAIFLVAQWPLCFPKDEIFIYFFLLSALFTFIAEDWSTTHFCLRMSLARLGADLVHFGRRYFDKTFLLFKCMSAKIIAYWPSFGMFTLSPAPHVDLATQHVDCIRIRRSASTPPIWIFLEAWFRFRPIMTWFSWTQIAYYSHAFIECIALVVLSVRISLPQPLSFWRHLWMQYFDYLISPLQVDSSIAQLSRSVG